MVSTLFPTYVKQWVREELHRFRMRPPLGWVRFGSLHRLAPISSIFGADRGMAICHFYIQKFLSSNVHDIRAHVLEIGDATYSRQFGGNRITKIDVLHATKGNTKATIVADLTSAPHIPSDTFDCIIFTQTLQHIYDVKAAIRTLHRILKPGGTLLATFPGISQISRYDMDRWGDYWRFTTDSTHRLFSEFWPSEAITIQAHGNVLVAMAYLYGLASVELEAKELEFHDPNYQVLITVRAIKPTNHISEAKMIAKGWDYYAKEWNPEQFQILAGSRIQHLGDEWTLEDISSGGTTYGLTPDIIAKFDAYLTEHLLNPYLPPAMEGLEIGPGGGRLTALLLPRTKLLHVADASPAMLSHLRRRFDGVSHLRYHSTNGVKLPELLPASLDYVIAFDVFVHFEPRLLFRLLQQIAVLLKPGGTGIIHYSNVMTPIGWQQFEMDLELNMEHRAYFAAMGVMCPQLMERFLNALQLELVSSDTGIIPRDALAVFRRPA